MATRRGSAKFADASVVWTGIRAGGRIWRPDRPPREIAMPDRIEQEIEELLAQIEHFPQRSLWQRLADPVVGALGALGRALPNVSLPHVSAGHILLVAIAIIVVGYLAIDSDDIARWVIAGGIVLFIAAFILSLRRSGGGGRPAQKYWRDRPMDLRPDYRPPPSSRRQGHSTRSWWDRWRGRR